MKKIIKHTRRLPDTDGEDTDAEQRQRDREDANKYRTRKEVRDQLVFYVSIAVGTLLALHTVLQMLGG